MRSKRASVRWRRRRRRSLSKDRKLDLTSNPNIEAARSVAVRSIFWARAAGTRSRSCAALPFKMCRLLAHQRVVRVACQPKSVRADQSAGLLSSQVAGYLGADVALETADGRTGQGTKDAVQVPFVVTQAAQCVLDPTPVRSGHTRFVGHGRHRLG